MVKTPVETDGAVIEQKPICGIIMPIAAMLPKYEASHWVDVRKVIEAAIVESGMAPQIVSDSFEGDVIQQRIINNLYYNPVVVCDVSGLNPNVMFELGMRITFKQPVIIITDDFATIPFDTRVIEHMGYPRDLHIHQTNEFIKKLSERITRLHEQKEDNSFRSFIEAFGTFEVLEPTKKVVEIDRLILDRLDGLERSVARIADRGRPAFRSNVRGASKGILRDFSIEFHDKAEMSTVEEFCRYVDEAYGPRNVRIVEHSTGVSSVIVSGVGPVAGEIISPELFVTQIPAELVRSIKSISIV